MAIAVGGAFVLTIGLILGDVILGPPSGTWRVVFWPVDLLLWASGSGVPLGNGKFEWTPAQDFAVWLGVGCSWFFWVSVVWFGVRLVRRGSHTAGRMIA